MKKLFAIVTLAFAVAAHAYPIVEAAPSGRANFVQTEVLVLNSAATAVPATAQTGRKALEIFNNGPYTIYCYPGGTPVVNKARPIASGASWYIEVADSVTVKCIAATADQVTTGATIVTEMK